MSSVVSAVGRVLPLRHALSRVRIGALSGRAASVGDGPMSAASGRGSHHSPLSGLPHKQQRSDVDESSHEPVD